MNQNDANRSDSLIDVSHASPPNKADLAALLEKHIGKDHAISTTAIAVDLCCDARRVRELVTDLREEDGIAVCGHFNTGYFIAATVDELLEECAFHRARALRSILTEAKLRHIPQDVVVGAVAAQLHDVRGVYAG